MTTKVIAKYALAAVATFGYGLPAQAGLIMDVAGGLFCEGNTQQVGCGGQAPDSGPATAPVGTTQHIEWFTDGDPRSELDTTLFNDLQLNNGAPATVFQMVMQTNRVIPRAGTWNLDGALNLTFQDHTKPGPVIHEDSLDINVDFIESLNAGNCPAGNPNGTICDDRYLLSLNLLDLMFMTDTTIYNVTFGLEAGAGTTVFTSADAGNVECPECGTLGAQQFIIYTAEQDTTSVNFTVAATKEPKVVSEPSALALLGLGLLGFGFSRRRALKT